MTFRAGSSVATTGRATPPRSGVHLGTLYRRWGGVDGIVLDVVGDRLASRSPVPDTGDFTPDMETYARQAADELSGADGILFLRALVAVRLGNDTEDELPPILARRFDEMQAMLDRARTRSRRAQRTGRLRGHHRPLVAGLLFGMEPRAPTRPPTSSAAYINSPSTRPSTNPGALCCS
ncbi:hypothetical protein [Streptomyces sp. KR55]|uniref:hypothetical protein n=1 Tax=Streptomyces sp. KR55 TaxID=3457425 RepID=UPI003FCFFD53